MFELTTAPTPQDMWNWALAARVTPIPIVAGSKIPPKGYMWKDAVPDTVLPHGTQSVAIRCSGTDATAALDFDCDCGRGGAYLSALYSRLGDQLAVRFGRPGRFLVPFRTQGPFEAHDFKLPCGCKVQLLYDKYFVAAGTHPDTGAPYAWANIGSPWPAWSYIQALGALAFLGTDVTNSTRAEAATQADINDAAPTSPYESELIRKFVLARLADMTSELRGMHTNRGTFIFNTVAVVAPAIDWGCITRSEIDYAIEAAGHSLDSKHGGRTLGEEVTRALADPIRAGNPVMAVSLRNRQFYVAVTGMLPDGRTTLDKIMDTVFDPLRFVVEDLLPEGLIFLVGDPKIGKSFIVLELVLAVSEAGTFWGRHCTPGDVAYFMLEDTPRRVKRRVEALRPRGHAKGRVHVFTQLDNIPRISLQPGVVGFIEHLEAFLDKNPSIKLVVIDTLVNIRPDKRDKTQGLYQADYESVAGLQRLISKRGLTCICVHHTRKSAEVDSITERMSGSNGLHGAGDGAWFITKKNGIVTFNTSMRDMEDVEMQLAKDEGSLVWKPIDETAPPTRQNSASMQAVISAVIQAGCEATPGDLALRTKLPDDTVRQYVRRLETRGDLERVGYGVYKTRGAAPKSRPEGARDLLVTAATIGTYADFQAGKMVDMSHVLPHLARNDKVPVTQGYAVSIDAARSLLSIFHDPNKLIKDMEGRKLAFVFDKVLLVPYVPAPVQASAAPKIVTLTEALKQQAAQMPWAIERPATQTRMPWDG